MEGFRVWDVFWNWDWTIFWEMMEMRFRVFSDVRGYSFTDEDFLGGEKRTVQDTFTFNFGDKCSTELARPWMFLVSENVVKIFPGLIHMEDFEWNTWKALKSFVNFPARSFRHEAYVRNCSWKCSLDVCFILELESTQCNSTRAPTHRVSCWVSGHGTLTRLCSQRRWGYRSGLEPVVHSLFAPSFRQCHRCSSAKPMNLRKL